jgi:spore coat protein U-like protein
MNTTLKNISRMTAVVALLATVGLAQAGTGTANLGVSASVAQNCTISTTPVAFGAYDPVSGGNVTAAGTVVVACTKATSSLSVGLGNGLNAVGSQRNLVGAVSTDKLAYSLLQPSTNTPAAACPSFGAGTAWTAASALTLTSPSSKTARTYNVCGQLASGQDVSVDSYSDTVVATINF